MRLDGCRCGEFRHRWNRDVEDVEEVPARRTVRARPQWIRRGQANYTLGGEAIATATGAAPPWATGLEAQAHLLLAAGQGDVWDVLSRQFEAVLIAAALASTRGRRIEAAQKLGIGRNTITRKIQELGLE